jgi:hypothetical protein
MGKIAGTYNHGYFCDRSHWNAVPKVFSVGRKPTAVLEQLFPGIDITNTSTSSTEIWFTQCVPEPISFIKIALHITTS